MPTVTALDVFSAWKVAESLLHAGHVEASICTLHGLLLAHAPFPLALFEAEVLTRLRLAHVFVYCTAAGGGGPDAARKTLDDVLQRFEGYTAPAVALFSAPSALAHFKSLPQQAADASAAAAMRRYADQHVFQRRFPFAVHLLKCHVLRLLGEAWLRKAAASSSATSRGSGGAAAAAGRQHLANALQCFRDASLVVDGVVKRTQDWLGMSDAASSHARESGSRRRQRGPDGEAGADVNAQGEARLMTECVWAAAVLRLATLQLSLRGAEAKTLHGLACNAFSFSSAAAASSTQHHQQQQPSSDGGGACSAVAYSHELVTVTQQALRRFFAAVGATPAGNGSGNKSNEHEQVLAHLFARFDRLHSSSSADDKADAGDADEQLIKMTTQVSSDALVSPTLATVALHHVIGLLMCAPSSALLRARAARVLELWSGALAVPAQRSADVDSGAAFQSFGQLWRFLLLLSSPERATGHDLRLLKQLGACPDGGGGGSATGDGFAAPIPVMGGTAASRRKSAAATASMQKPASGSILLDDEAGSASTAGQASGAPPADAVTEWLAEAVMEGGTAYCATRLVEMLHTIYRFARPAGGGTAAAAVGTSSSPSSPTAALKQQPQSADGGESNGGASRGEECLSMLNDMLYFIEAQLRKLTAPPALAEKEKQGTAAAVVVTAKSLAEVKFLVAVKVCGYLELALFDMLEQDICAAVSKLDALRRYVVLFRAHTANQRGTLHLLVAMLALHLGDRAAVQAHCAAAQECEVQRCGGFVLLDDDDDDDDDDDEKGDATRKPSGSIAPVNAALSWAPTRDALLVEAVASYSLIRSGGGQQQQARSGGGAKSTTTNAATAQRLQLRQRFDALVGAAMSAIRDAEELDDNDDDENDAARNGKNAAAVVNSTPSSSSSLALSTVDNRVLMWKLLAAARCIEDLDGAEALRLLRDVIDAATAATSAAASNGDSGVPVAAQYILATALRLQSIALHHTPSVHEDNVKASRQSNQASFNAAAVIGEEGCIVHCLAWALSTTVVVTTDKERDKQAELHRRVSSTSEGFGAQVQLLLNGPQMAGTVQALLHFLPGDGDSYDSWVGRGAPGRASGQMM